MVYQLPAGLSLDETYSAMEEVKASLDIDDYSLSQTTLDDVSHKHYICGYNICLYCYCRYFCILLTNKMKTLE